MSYDLTNDAQRAAGPNLPGISSRNLMRVRFWTLVILALVFMGLFVWWLRGVFTDWLWFDHLGFGAVYSKILFLKIWLFVGATATSAIVLSLNLHFVFKFARGQSTLGLREDSYRLIWGMVVGGAALTVLISSLIFGFVAAGRWETFLLFFNKISFGATDPQFGLDYTFYVVNLRLFHFIQGWFMGLFITSAVVSLTLYVAVYGLRGLGFVLAPRMLKHMGILGFLLMISIAAGHLLDVYELVLAQKQSVAGATYTDVHARIPVLWLMTSVAFLAAALFFASIYYGGLRVIIGSFSLWVLVVLLAGFAFPALFQRFQVDPDEFVLELPYIQRNIEATRSAYQIDRFQERQYPVGENLDAARIAENRSTFDNIRLWDLEPLRDAYNQLQFTELYYSFLNMDSDRYVIDGQLRQVLVAARELDPGSLPVDARNWVNRRLQYTHGYGLTMSPATGFSPGEGRPEYLIQDIPIRGSLPISQPEIYYGENPASFAIVNTLMSEIDPNPNPLHYDGDGGIALSSTPRRLAYAAQFGDINILLSDQISDESRIQYRRRIDQRVKEIAPFLKMDADPYPVVDRNGKLWWLQDVYTTTDRIPYSTRTDDSFNYIRNSAKVVVDAYTGDVDFYVIDQEDPLLQMYIRAFPTMFKPFDDMPPDLREHIRYPIDMFLAQSRMYLRYHVTDPQVFFNQREQWAIPLETRFGKRGDEVRPAYLVLKNPGEDKEEFLLMLPFTPASGKKNLVGWLTARNDGPNYGEIISFQVPSDPQIDGPSQVEARIENDQEISAQFTLWDGAGSQIIRGQLLVIPVADTIIYVEPLYLQSEVLAFPELKKVILADSSNVVMADTINEGLAMLIGEAIFVDRPDTPVGPPAGVDLEELERIQDAISGMGDALDDLEEALDSLRESLGGTAP